MAQREDGFILCREYSGNARQDAAEIARECVLGWPGRPRHGVSSSWAGTIEEREEIAEILAPLNIVYFDDLSGLWKIRNP